MTQEHQAENPQGEQAENTEQEGYYYSINRVWRGQGLGMRSTHHKKSDCRIGRRIKEKNRIKGRREDTTPCHVCCPNETIEAQNPE